MGAFKTEADRSRRQVRVRVPVEEIHEFDQYLPNRDEIPLATVLQILVNTKEAIYFRSDGPSNEAAVVLPIVAFALANLNWNDPDIYVRATDSPHAITFHWEERPTTRGGRTVVDKFLTSHSHDVQTWCFSDVPLPTEVVEGTICVLCDDVPTTKLGPVAHLRAPTTQEVVAAGIVLRDELERCLKIESGSCLLFTFSATNSITLSTAEARMALMGRFYTERPLAQLAIAADPFTPGAPLPYDGYYEFVQPDSVS